MRRVGTGLAVAAVLGVGLAAAIDALPEGEEGVSVERGPAAVAGPVGRLRELGVRGVLTYSDQRCRLHAVRLPSLLPASAPTIESCEPHIPTGGIGTWKGDVVWSGFGYQAVQVVLSREEIGHAIRRHFGLARGRFRATQAVSLANGRYAVTVDSVGSPRWRLVAAFDRQGLDFVEAGAGTLRPSPRGRYLAVLDPGDELVEVYTSAGRFIPLPDLPEAHAIAWSPDERWTALATRRSVYVFRTEQPESALLRIPLAVRDLDWGT